MPSHEFNDELLSAYLDGELTDEERARVEAQLADDEPARRLMEELAKVASGVKQLPRVDAPVELKQRILSAVRNTQVTPSANGRATGRAGTDAGARWQSVSIGRSRRGWAWAALAVAAALVLMILTGEPRDHARVAEPRGLDQAENKNLRRFATDRFAAEEGRDGERAKRELSDFDRTVRSYHDLPLPDAAGERAERLRANADSLQGESVDLQEDAVQLNGMQELAVEDTARRAAIVSGVDAQDGANVESFRREAQSYFHPVSAVDKPELAQVVSNAVRIDNVGAAFDVNASADYNNLYCVTVNVNSTVQAGEQLENYFLRNSIDVEKANAPVSFGYGATAGGTVSGGAADQTSGANDIDTNGAGFGGRADAQPASGGGQPTESMTQEMDADDPIADAATDEARPRIVAVEAPLEQVRNLLADMNADQQNVTAIAVLQSAVAPLAIVADDQRAQQQQAQKWGFSQYNRNADEAVEKVAGVWRIDRAADYVVAKQLLPDAESVTAHFAQPQRAVEAASKQPSNQQGASRQAGGENEKGDLLNRDHAEYEYKKDQSGDDKLEPTKSREDDRRENANDQSLVSQRKVNEVAAGGKSASGENASENGSQASEVPSRALASGRAPQSAAARGQPRARGRARVIQSVPGPAANSFAGGFAGQPQAPTPTPVENKSVNEQLAKVESRAVRARQGAGAGRGGTGMDRRTNLEGAPPSPPSQAAIEWAASAPSTPADRYSAQDAPAQRPRGAAADAATTAYSAAPGNQQTLRVLIYFNYVLPMPAATAPAPPTADAADSQP